jgi:ring-1,2-phenylacetyl-CoA epoxidase subunit PaaB
VFQQQKSGGHFIHVGSVHAPNEEIALLFAKEQYGRRGKSVGMWIAPTNAIVSIPEEDVDMFDATPEKKYREVGAYMVRNRVEQYKKDNRNE